MNSGSVADESGDRQSRSVCVVSGTLSLDTLLLPSGTHHDVPGGSALFAALGASLVRDCAVVGSIGRDFPDDVLASLSSRGVDLRGISRRDEPTFRWKARYSADMSERETLDRAKGAGHSAPVLPNQLVSGDSCVLLGSMSPAHQEAVLAQVGSNSVYGVDTMAHWVREERETLASLVQRTAVVFASEDECALLGQDSDPFKAARALISSGTGLVVLKAGADGAYLIRKHASPMRCPAVPSSVIDPTGAGDSLAGAFLAASSLGFRPEVALAHGVAAAAIALEGVGVSGFAVGNTSFEAKVQWALAHMEMSKTTE